MTQLTAMMMRSNLSKAGAAFLLVSLGSACGSSGDEVAAGGGSSTDGGNTVSPPAVNLGMSGTYAILAKKSGISTVPTSAITGNIGVSPAAASYITGFALILPAGGAFSKAVQVTGNVYAADYASPTPANLTTAIGAMQTA